jgi:hypothetical protein
VPHVEHVEGSVGYYRLWHGFLLWKLAYISILSLVNPLCYKSITKSKAILINAQTVRQQHQ